MTGGAFLSLAAAAASARASVAITQPAVVGVLPARALTLFCPCPLRAAAPPAGTDGVVRQWELRRCVAINSFAGHRDAVTGLSLSPDGNTLLSFGMDNAVRAWDVRPFTTAADRCVKVFTGATNNFEQSAIRCAWSGNGESIACGSADRNVYVWDYGSGRVTHVLPGHTGIVHAVAFSSTAPVIASGAHDKRVFLGELIAAPGTAGAGAAAAGGAGTGDSL